MYILKINRSEDILRPMVSYYSQGISAQCIILKDITHWSISRIVFIRGLPVSFSLNRHFIAAQRLMKTYSRYLRSLRSLRVLFKRELSGILPRWTPPDLTLLYV